MWSLALVVYSTVKFKQRIHVFVDVYSTESQPYNALLTFKSSLWLINLLQFGFGIKLYLLPSLSLRVRQTNRQTEARAPFYSSLSNIIAQTMSLSRSSSLAISFALSLMEYSIPMAELSEGFDNTCLTNLQECSCVLRHLVNALW